MRRGYVDIKEGQVHYRTEGEGEPLLLLHQTAFSSDEYTDMIPVLSKRCRVIAMDTMGYGSSDKPPQGFTIEDYGRTIIQFLDGLGIEKTTVAGHHTGATLTGEIAAVYPERVEKIIMSGVSLYEPEEREKFLNDPMFKPMEITEDGSFMMDHWKFMHDIHPGYSPETIFRMVLAELQAGPRLHDAHYAAFRYDKAPKLPLIKCPALIICGSGDMFVPKMEAVKKLIPRNRSLIIEGGGNALAWEKPVEFAQAILDFMENPGV